MARGVDRMSDLPDELLLRVLRFLPGKDAAATTALSRRWRSPLWRSSGVVNLEKNVEDWGYYMYNYNDKSGESDDDLFFARRDAFVSAAEAALDAADVPVTRLTLRVTGHDSIDMFLNGGMGVKLPSSSRHQGALAKLLSHRAARRLEELRLDAYDVYSDEQTNLSSLGLYVFNFNLGPVPSENLGVLDLTNCRDLVPPSSSVAFPRLSSLRLHRGTVRLDALQSLINAAPALVTVHLESIVISPPTDGKSDYHGRRAFGTPPPPPAQALLRLPAATVLAIERCDWTDNDGSPETYTARRHHIADNAGVVPVEIDAPRLRRFRYKGLLRPFSLTSRPPDLAHADLHFDPRARDDRVNIIFHNLDEGNLETLWRFLHNFAGAKELKLNVNPLEDMVVLSEERRAELLPVFPVLERLELRGVHRPKGKTAAVAIANLLRCCPTLHDLRINLTSEHHYPHYYHDENLFLERKFSADRDKSTDLLNRYRNSDPTAVSPEGNDATNYDDVSEIPGLSQHSFDCLRSSLVRVGLQFRLGAANCLGVKLIKFFAENAMVLEEMFIDGGNTKLWEHMTYRVEKLISDSSIRRKPGASSFVVLPLRGDY